MHAHPLEARMAHLEGAFDQFGARLTSVDRRLDSLEHQTSLRFDQMDRRFNWLTGLVFSSWVTTIVAAIFHH